MDFQEFKQKFETELSLALSFDAIGEVSPLTDAMRYASLDGGKRLRPIMAFLGAKFAKGGELDFFELDRVLKFAVAVELIHCYSLVHDDLPAMDNDDFRRGKLTVHKKFGEDMAILAGDALLNLAYERIFGLISQTEDKKIMQSGAILAKNAGITGMVKGQCLDLKTKNPNLGALLQTNSFKTACLFKAALLGGAVLIGIDDEELSSLENYAQNFGAAFQIADDILDTEKSENSIVRLIGISEAKNLCEKFLNLSLTSVENFKEKNLELKNFALGILKKAL